MISGERRYRLKVSTPNGFQLNRVFIGTRSCPPFRARLRDQRREPGIEARDVREKSRESNELQCDQPNVSISVDKKFRAQMNCDRTSDIHEEKPRQQEREIEFLIACHQGIEAAACFSRAIAHSCANKAQIIRKEQPTYREKGRYECEPA